MLLQHITQIKLPVGNSASPANYANIQEIWQILDLVATNLDIENSARNIPITYLKQQLQSFIFKSRKYQLLFFRILGEKLKTEFELLCTARGLRRIFNKWYRYLRNKICKLQICNKLGGTKSKRDEKFRITIASNISKICKLQK